MRSAPAQLPDDIEALKRLVLEREAQLEIERHNVRAQQTLIELLQTNIAQRRALCLASVDLARALGVPLEGGARWSAPSET